MKRILVLLAAMGVSLGIGVVVYHHLNQFSQVTYAPVCQIGPAPSPDGRWLVFAFVPESAPVTGTLWIQPVLSPNREPRQLLAGERLNGGFSWSPDSQWISYTAFLVGDQSKADESQVFRVNPQTGERVQLTFGHGQNIGESTSWSKNDQIAFVKGKEIFIVSPSGGTHTKITNLSAMSPRLSPEEIAWSPDGQHIVFSGSAEGKDAEFSLWNVDANTGRVTRLTYGPYDAEPTWINGETVVFNQQLTKENSWALSSVNIRTGKVVRLRTDGVYFSSGYVAKTGELYVARGRYLDFNGRDSNIFRGFHIFRIHVPLMWGWLNRGW